MNTKDEHLQNSRVQAAACSQTRAIALQNQVEGPAAMVIASYCSRLGFEKNTPDTQLQNTIRSTQLPEIHTLLSIGDRMRKDLKRASIEKQSPGHTFVRVAGWQV